MQHLLPESWKARHHHTPAPAPAGVPVLDDPDGQGGGGIDPHVGVAHQRECVVLIRISADHWGVDARGVRIQRVVAAVGSGGRRKRGGE